MRSEQEIRDAIAAVEQTIPRPGEAGELSALSIIAALSWVLETNHPLGLGLAAQLKYVSGPLNTQRLNERDARLNSLLDDERHRN